MSEFINVTEVEKLPLNKVDSLIAIDSNNNIKRTAIKIDQEVIPESTNPVSSKGVYDIIVVLGNDFGEAVSDLENHLGAFEDDIREEISVLNEECATKEWVDNKVADVVSGDVDSFVISGKLGYQEMSNLQFITGSHTDLAANLANGKASEVRVVLNDEMIVTPTTMVTENGNVGVLLILGVDMFSIYISADGEIVPEYLAEIPSDCYTKNQVYTRAEINAKLTDYATTDYVQTLIGDVNSVLDQINGEVV